jgi:hypothetical protein
MTLSVVMHTCRRDDPGLPAPVLRMMLDSMIRQNYEGGFELIIVDLLWKYRKNYLTDNCNPTVVVGKIPFFSTCLDYKFPVLHIPDRPTPFRDKNLLRIASPKNTGIIYARGDAVVFTDDCQVVPYNALSCLAEWAEKGIGATMCYEKRYWGRNLVEDKKTGKDTRGIHLGIPQGSAKEVVPRSIGFLGGSMSMVPKRTLLKINGWDEFYDGSRQLEDADMLRLLIGASQRMAYDNRSCIIEYEVDAYDSRVVNKNPIKCNGAYSAFAWSIGRRTPNSGNRVNEAIKRMNWRNCSRLRPKNKCHPHMSPCTKLGDPEILEEIYNDSRLTFNLEELNDNANWNTAHQDLL